jgi:hypothetical protein
MDKKAVRILLNPNRFFSSLFAFTLFPLPPLTLLFIGGRQLI